MLIVGLLGHTITSQYYSILFLCRFCQTVLMCGIVLVLQLLCTSKGKGPFLRLPKGHHITFPCIETHSDTMSYTQLLLQLLMLPVLDIRCYDFCPSHLTRYQLMLGGQRHSRIQRLLKAFTYDCVKSGIQPGTARSLAHFAINPHSVMTDYVCHMYHA